MARQEIMTPQKLRILLLRFMLLIAIWGLVIHFTSRASVTYIEYRKASSELSQVSAEYDRLFHDYSEQLWEGERLKQDKEYQRQILKDSYYYFEPSETPLIVVDE